MQNFLGAVMISLLYGGLVILAAVPGAFAVQIFLGRAVDWVMKFIIRSPQTREKLKPAICYGIALVLAGIFFVCLYFSESPPGTDIPSSRYYQNAYW